VAGFIYAALGVIYAVLLALVVIAAWERYERARVTVEEEANAVAEIFWTAHWIPQPQGRELQEVARSYAEEVIDEEWPLMQQGQMPSLEGTQETPSGWVIIDDLRTRLHAFEPHTDAEQDIYAEGLDEIQSLNDARRMRLVAASESMPPIYVGHSDLWRDSDDRLHLPLRLGEHLGTQADGGVVGGGARAGTVYYQQPGAPFLRQYSC
jgi:hypothetical protein